MPKVLVSFIQDRSGSMESVWDETVNGFKVFVKTLQEKEGLDDVTYLFSLTVFDTQIDEPIEACPIKDVNLDILEKLGPRGGTALLDAVGITLQKVDSKGYECEKNIVVIVTDGQENSSREWTKEKIKSVIEKKSDLGNWTFTYLGASETTWSDSSGISLDSGSTRSYTPGKARKSYRITAMAVSRLASDKTRTSSRSMFDEDDAVLDTISPGLSASLRKESGMKKKDEK